MKNDKTKQIVYKHIIKLDDSSNQRATVISK